MASEFVFRPIRSEDDAAVASLIRTVMPEFGASGPGFAINDPEVSTMFVAYSAPRHRYYVVTREERVVGGAGVAPLSGGDAATCEIRKMYFLPETRGHGLGEKLLAQLLEDAKAFGFRRAYLETLERMNAAQHLYQKMGFREIPGPVGNTGHFSCDRFFARDL